MYIYIHVYVLYICWNYGNSQLQSSSESRMFPIHDLFSTIWGDCLTLWIPEETIIYDHFLHSSCYKTGWKSNHFEIFETNPSWRLLAFAKSCYIPIWYIHCPPISVLISPWSLDSLLQVTPCSTGFQKLEKANLFGAQSQDFGRSAWVFWGISCGFRPNMF